ncbi:MAG: multidrug ABC transporter [Dehalococcoidia bacterium]|nr:multidrug ABC transporter [Dehalococcoidia bacterium]
MHFPKPHIPNPHIAERIAHAKQLLHIGDNLSHLSHKKEFEVLKRITKMCFKYKKYIFLGITGVIGIVSAQLYLPFLLGNGIDKSIEIIASGSSKFNDLYLVGFLIIITSMLRGLFGFLIQYNGEKIGNNITTNLRSDFHKKLQSLSFSFHDKIHSGNLMSRGILDIEGVGLFVRTGFLRTIEILLLMFFGGILLVSVDWKIGLLSLIFIIPTASLATTTRLRLRKIWTKIQQFYSDLNTKLQENLIGVRVVRAFGGQNHEIKKFRSSHKNVTNLTIESIEVSALGQSLIGFFFLITWSLIIWVCGIQVISGNLTLGEMTQSLVYLGMLQRPVRMIGMMVNAYARATSCGLRLFEILDKEPNIKSLNNPKSLDKIHKIEAKDIVFKFDHHSEKNILNNISFKVSSNQILGIIGPPGSGKSSLAQLIPRFYDIQEGSLTINDIDIRNIDITELRKEVGIISQNTFLFNMTIKENISYGAPNSEMNEIIECAQIAEIHDFIESLPEKYETTVGEFGVSLSGGQKQRISIARTLLKKPSLVIFDDSLSALDSITDQKIREHLETSISSQITIIISHRIDSLEHANEIIVLDKGNISQRGTPSELLKKDGIYKTISDIQHPKYEKEKSLS